MNAGPEQRLPADGALQIQFDRLLLAGTVTRQSLLLVDANNQPLTPVPSYDPVARVVTLSRQQGLDWLIPDQPYKLYLHVAQSAADPNGIRAIDGAELTGADPRYLAAAQAVVIGFQTSAPTGTTYSEPKASFCADVLPVFRRSCALGGACHAAIGQPAQGLVLETSAGVAATAINRVANEANTGPLAGQGAAPGGRFGRDMPVIAPGMPANSWLLYKVLLARPTDPARAVDAHATKCDGSPGTPHLAPFVPAPFATPMDDTERAVLGSLLLGREMPYPALTAVTAATATGVAPTGVELTFDELERLRLWIAQGAKVDPCAACEP